MMRFLLALGVAALWTGALQAQPAAMPAPQQPTLVAPATYDPVVDARERERLAAERDVVQRQTGETEADCYQRFAVSACLRDVRKQRRVALEALRKQELALNDLRRTAATEAQARKVQERQAEKEGASAAKSTKSSAPADPAAVDRASKAEAADMQRRERLQREYDAKQRLARERQEARDQKLQNSTSRPLPVPP
jgi:hypothetical protein